ncbi:pretoxin HINT domain protein [Neisseria meningitidis 69100]|nr:pretoxin HINT domain protein [Neisseria meningitidis 69100]
MVKTADGYKAIARIRTGDRVFAKDEASGKTGYKPVTARYGNPYQETVYIEISDGIGKIQTLVSNKIHPFYSQGKWIQAGRLKKGDTLLSESGAKQTVQNITLKQQPLKAYNLTVADWHTYFVKGNQAERKGFGFIMIARQEKHHLPPYMRMIQKHMQQQRNWDIGK